MHREQFAGLPVVTSPFRRCLQTVGPWCDGDRLVVDYRLCEHHGGDAPLLFAYESLALRFCAPRCARLLLDGL